MEPHVHCCPDCRAMAAHECECPEGPSTPRPCNERIPGERNLNCPTIGKSPTMRWWDEELRNSEAIREHD